MILFNFSREARLNLQQMNYDTATQMNTDDRKLTTEII